MMFAILKSMRINADDYCDIVNTYHEDTLVFADGSMLSLLKFNGFESVIELHDLYDFMDRIALDLNELFLKQGYRMVFRFSRETADNDTLLDILHRKHNTAKRLNLDVDFILEEQFDSYEDTVYKEYAYIGLITSPHVLDKLDKSMKDDEKIVKQPIAHGMDLYSQDSSVYGKHQAFVTKVVNSLSNPNYYINVQKLDIVHVLRIIREQIYMEGNEQEWLPALMVDDIRYYDLPKGYRSNVAVPYLPDPTDISHLVPEPLGQQLLGSGFHKVSEKGLPSNVVKIGEHLFLSAMATTTPKVPMPFNELFTLLNGITAKNEQGVEYPIPYAISFELSSKGQLAVKESLGSFIGSFGYQNGVIYRTLSDLHKEGEKYAVVGFRCSVMTWARHQEQGVQSLKERYLRLCGAFEAWGGIGVQHFSGDNYLQWRNNIIGLGVKNNCQMNLVPMTEALKLLPWQRPLSPFAGRGSVIYRSVDGKIMPFELVSDLTPDQHMIVTGTKGSGKSVFLSNMLFEHVVNPKNQNLPRILVVDVGFSSDGVVQMIRNALPEHLRHLAVTKSLKNNADTAINFFDIKVGLKKPTDSERTVCIGFLNALLTPKEKPMGIEGMSDLVPMLVDDAYRIYLGNDDDSTPKLFSTASNKELNELLIELKPFEFEHRATKAVTGQVTYLIPQATFPVETALELSRILQEHANYAPTEVLKQKYYRARDLAWRLAMPTLPDLLNIIKQDKYSDIFKHHLETGDKFIDRATQIITMAVRAYPIFANTTSFDIDNANIAVLDLQEVIDKSNPQHTSLFYQICLNLFGRNFAFQEGEMQKVVPDSYMDYYRQWQKDIKITRKLLLIDEFANMQSAPVGMLNIEKAMLEYRKHGMIMVLASQQASHFRYNTGTRTINLLTGANYWISLSTPSDIDLDFAVDTYKIPNNVVREFDHIRFEKGLGSVFYLFVAGKGKKYHLFPNFKLGSKMLWICNTTPNDRAMRAVMLELATSQKEAVEALAYYFGASASDRLQHELDRIAMLKIAESEKQKQTQKLYEQTAQLALDEYRSWLASTRANQKLVQRNSI